MEQDFKSITKQLLTAATILTSVTVMSFGIRHIRLRAYRADIVELAPNVRPSDTEEQPRLKQTLYADAESNYYTEDSYIVDAEPDPQYTEESYWDQQAPAVEYADAKTKSGKKDKALSKTKLSKAYYEKAKASKNLEKISLSEHEDLYFSKEGEFWYVSKHPDGSTTKMQVQIDDYTGELVAVDGDYYAKSKSSQDLYRISMSDNEDIYISKEGQAWYVNEQPDGKTVKMQVQTD